MIFRADKPMFLEPTDDRYWEYDEQLKETGISDSEMWNLDITIAHFLAPRLRHFRKTTQSYPTQFDTIEEWYEVLDKMIAFFEAEIDKDFISEINDEGLKLFYENYFSLWD